MALHCSDVIMNEAYTVEPFYTVTSGTQFRCVWAARALISFYWHLVIDYSITRPSLLQRMRLKFSQKSNSHLFRS